jgi:hypothetical protein
MTTLASRAHLTLMTTLSLPSFRPINRIDEEDFRSIPVVDPHRLQHAKAAFTTRYAA